MLHPQNRSFLYGDGFFDTLRVENWEIPWLDLHFERWEKSCQAMGISSPFSKDEWRNQIFSLITQPFARVRSQLWSGNGYQYGYRGEVETLIQVFPWEKKENKPLKGGFLTNERLPKGTYQWMKSNSAFFYSLVEKKALDFGWTEGILLNEAKELVEGCHSALFWKRDGKWWTHPNGLDGIWSTAKEASLRHGTPLGERVWEGKITIGEITQVSEWAMGNAMIPWLPFQLMEEIDFSAFF